MRGRAVLWLALLGAAVLAVVVVVGATRDPVIGGDTQCGPFWAQQFRDPCNDFNRERSVIVVGSAVGSVALVGVAWRHRSRD